MTGKLQGQLLEITTRDSLFLLSRINNEWGWSSQGRDREKQKEGA